MKNDEMTKKIAAAANSIAGSAFSAAAGTLEERLETAIGWRNLGTDGDLTHEDRDALRRLLDAATGITADLMDADTGDRIRLATVAEAVDSALARPEGHILVAGRRCYVQL